MDWTFAAMRLHHPKPNANPYYKVPSVSRVRSAVRIRGGSVEKRSFFKDKRGKKGAESRGRAVTKL